MNGYNPYGGGYYPQQQGYPQANYGGGYPQQQGYGGNTQGYNPNYTGGNTSGGQYSGGWGNGGVGSFTPNGGMGGIPQQYMGQMNARPAGNGGGYVSLSGPAGQQQQGPMGANRDGMQWRQDRRQGMQDQNRYDRLQNRVSNLGEQWKAAGSQDQAGILAKQQGLQGRLDGMQQTGATGANRVGMDWRQERRQSMQNAQQPQTQVPPQGMPTGANRPGMQYRQDRRQMQGGPQPQQGYVPQQAGAAAGQSYPASWGESKPGITGVPQFSNGAVDWGKYYQQHPEQQPNQDRSFTTADGRKIMAAPNEFNSSFGNLTMGSGGNSKQYKVNDGGGAYGFDRNNGWQVWNEANAQNYVDPNEYGQQAGQIYRTENPGDVRDVHGNILRAAPTKMSGDTGYYTDPYGQNSFQYNNTANWNANPNFQWG